MTSIEQDVHCNFFKNYVLTYQERADGQPPNSRETIKRIDGKYKFTYYRIIISRYVVAKHKSYYKTLT